MIKPFSKVDFYKIGDPLSANPLSPFSKQGLLGGGGELRHPWGHPRNYGKSREGEGSYTLERDRGGCGVCAT